MERRSPVKSAETVAALRNSFSNDLSLDYKDDYARLFLYRKNRILSALRPTYVRKYILNKISPGCHNFIYIRTRLIDDTLVSLVKKGLRQVIILGAGYDSRALRFNQQLLNCKVYEFDLERTQNYKIQRLKDHTVRIPENLSFVSIDFTRETLESRLQQVDISFQEPTLVIWEGVSYYLSKKDVSNVLGFLSDKFSKLNLIFDYTTSDFVNGDTSTYGAKEVQNWLKKINEPFRFGLSPDEMNEFVKELGYKVAFNKSPEQTEKEFLQPLGKIEKTYGHIHYLMAYK